MCLNRIKTTQEQKTQKSAPVFQRLWEMGGYVPMIVDVLPFDTTQITSDKNWSHPKYGDPCHPLASGQHPPTVVIHELSERDRMPESGSAPRLI